MSSLAGVSRFLFPQEIPFQTLQDSTAEKLISGISRQNNFMGQTLFYPSWLLRYYIPRAYTQLREAVRDVFEAGGYLVEDIYRTLSARAERGEVMEPRSLLEHWILNGELSQTEVLTNTVNMLAGGLDTVRNYTPSTPPTHTRMLVLFTMQLHAGSTSSGVALCPPDPT